MSTAVEPRFARVAAMIGDPTRARMLARLLDGSMRTAGEIAGSAGITAATASAHLAKLVDTGLITVREQGRHRYFRLADSDVAHAIEALAIVAEPKGAADPRRATWTRHAMQPLRHARTCYGHLAGTLGVRLHDTLVHDGVLTPYEDGFRMEPAGRRWLEARGFDPGSVAERAMPGTGRGIAYPCVDWSERRDHFAGPLAVALLDHFLDAHWLARIGTSRALAVNEATRLLLERFVAPA